MARVTSSESRAAFGFVLAELQTVRKQTLQKLLRRFDIYLKESGLSIK